MEEKKKLWGFETKQVVYAAIGAALYAVLAIATNMLQLPGLGMFPSVLLWLYP